MAKSMNLALSVVLAACAIGASPVALANVVGPGAVVSPDVLTLGAGSTLLADTGAQAFSTSTISGTAEEWVYADSARSGDLTWLIEVVNSAASTDGVGRVTAANFTGFTTDVGYESGSPGTVPTNVDRSVSGGTIGFNFPIPGVSPGASTALLAIETNAKQWTAGTLAVIDAQTANLAGFSPSVVPEASTWAMLLTGFAGLSFVFHRGRKTSRFTV